VIRDLFYLSLIVFAIIAIQTSILRNAIIYLSVFSLLCSAVYLLLGAPDVAIAEAVIGCTLSTILYLVALKKYRIFTVYYRTISQEVNDIERLKHEKEELKSLLTTYCRKKELQLDLINTTSNFKQIMDSVSYDVIIVHTKKGLWLNGFRNSYQYTELIDYCEKTLNLPVHVRYIHEEEVISSLTGEE